VFIAMNADIPQVHVGGERPETRGRGRPRSPERGLALRSEWAHHKVCRKMAPRGNDSS
jgi:hypothetical protein